MSTGEQSETITLGRLRGSSYNNEPFTDLAREIKEMSAEERESFLKRLEKLIASIRNGGGASAAG